MKLWIILLVFLVLVFLDKTITFVNLNLVQRTNPDNYLTIEKNPAARYFFQHLGLGLGSIAYGIITIITLFIVFYFLGLWLNQERALWIIMLIYSLVIGNNIFFALKFGGLFN